MGKSRAKWDEDSSEFAVPVKKKSNLDAEFAKMLGLEDDFATGGAAESPTPFGDDDDAGKQDSDRPTSLSDFGVKGAGGAKDLDDTFSYEPRVRGGAGKEKSSDRGRISFSDGHRGASAPSKEHSDFLETTPAAPEDHEKDAVGGLSASFFSQDESSSKAKDEDYSPLSFLSSTTTERRGGRGGRRGGGTASGASTVEDPFASVGSGRDLFATPRVEADEVGGRVYAHKRDDKSSFDSLFGGASHKIDDIFASKREVTPLARTDRAAKGEETAQGNVFPVARKTTSSAPSSQREDLSKAKDDLLSELFPSESSRERNWKKEQSPKQQSQSSLGSAKDDLLAELFPSDPKAESKNERSFLSDKRSDEQESGTVSPPQLQQPKPVGQQPRKTGGLDDISSARDSLLMDLFPESPPKPRERRRSSRSSTPSASPVKETPTLEGNDESEESYSLVRRSAISPQKSSPQRVEEQQQQRPTRSTTNVSSGSPPVSPGRAKTLASPSAGSIKEVDFEQSKDSLLDELLSPTPAKASPTSSPGRDRQRHSYSQSFEDEKDDFVEEHLLPLRRQASSSRNPSPSRSPEKRASDSPKRVGSSSAPSPQESRDSRSRCGVVEREAIDESASTQAATRDSQNRSAVLESAVKKREEELRAEAESAKATLVATHESELARLHELIHSVTQQLNEERAKNEAFASETVQRQAKLKLLEQENQVFMQQIAVLQSEKQQLQQDVHLVQTEHALCANQSALFQAERTGFMNQLKNLEDQNRQLLHQFAQEKQDHQATQLKFASFQEEKEQDAQLQKQRESHQMGKLFQQLQTSLVSLKMLQEQVADEEVTKHEVESESRLRMITSLESSSRQCAKQTEEECFRLSSLLNSLETTLRHYRQEHLEEKERLRQEQMRLNVLATHFQAQSTVMHEKADANTQMLAQYFTSAMQDVRVAESRLGVRRQNLEDEEKQLYDERAKFAAYREEFAQQQARETQRLQVERVKVGAKWKELEREREDLEDVIASHEEEFQYLQQQKRALEEEKENIEYRALQIAEMAARFEALTQQMVTREEEMAKERDEMDKWRQEFVSKQQSVHSEKQKLDERELRLHSQLKQLEKSRKRLNDQRKQHLVRSTIANSSFPSSSATMSPSAVSDLELAKQRLMDYTRDMAGIRKKNETQPVQISPVDNNRRWRTRPLDTHHISNNNHALESLAKWSSPLQRKSSPSVSHAMQQSSLAPKADPPLWKDPSGLSSSFRQLVEDNWKKREWSLDIADAALHKERMWINCIGLDTNPSTCDAQHLQRDKNTSTRTHHHQQQQQQRTTAPASSSGSKVSSSSSIPSTNYQRQQQNPTATTSSSRPPPPPPLQRHSVAAKPIVKIDL